MSWPLFCHNYSNVSDGSHTIAGGLGSLILTGNAPVMNPQCQPYACSTMVDWASGAAYLWPLNDKHTTYSGVIDEAGGSEILTTGGSVSNVGQKTETAVDSCVGITAWQVRPEGYASNTATLEINNPHHEVVEDLVNGGLTLTVAIKKEGSSTIDSGSGNVFSVQWNHASWYTRVRALFTSPTALDLTVWKAPGTETKETATVTAVTAGTELLITLVVTLTEQRLYVGDTLVASQNVSILAPVSNINHIITLGSNSEWILQNFAIYDTALTDDAVASLALAYDRNFATYGPPSGCPSPTLTPGSGSLTLTGLVPTPCQIQAVDDTDLVVHGYFTEGTGTTSPNKFGSDTDAWTINDTNSWVDGPDDCSYGIVMSDHIDSCTRSVLPASLAADITLMWWMRQPAGADNFVLSTSAVNQPVTGEKYSGHIFNISLVDSSHLYLTTGNNAGADSGKRRTWQLPGLPHNLDDTWRHVAITFKNGGEDPDNTYLNGVVTTAPTYQSGSSSTIVYNTTDAELRANTTWNINESTPTTQGSSWGEFADFRAYSTVLSAERIYAIAHGDSPQPGKITLTGLVPTVVIA